MSWNDDYGYAYSRAHNSKGVRNAHQLDMIAHAFADLRDQSNRVASPIYQPVVTNFEAFWAAWEGNLIEPKYTDMWDWVVSNGPPHSVEYFDIEENGVTRVGRRERLAA